MSQSNKAQANDLQAGDISIAGHTKRIKEQNGLYVLIVVPFLQFINFVHNTIITPIKPAIKTHHKYMFRLKILSY